MIETLNNIDTSLFLFLNQLNAPWLDPIMLTISYNKILFIGILLGISVYGVKVFKKWFLLAFFFCLLGFGLSDSISSKVFKPYFERLRPCKQPELKEKVHLAGKKCWGGKYGFFSSHASNSFTIAMFFWLLFRKKNKWFSLFFVYSSLIAYSRIYLAKHFPGDVLVGAIFGLGCGWLAFKGFSYLKLRFQDQHG